MRQTARGEKEGTGIRTLTNPEVHLQFGCGASSEILIILSLTRDLNVLIPDSWSSSSMKWVHYLFDGIHFSLNRERGRNYFFDRSETKRFSAGRAKSDKNIVLRLANEANTSTNEFQLFQIKVDVAEVKMTPVPQSSFSCSEARHERSEWQPIINASGVERGKYFSSSIFPGYKEEHRTVWERN